MKQDEIIGWTIVGFAAIGFLSVCCVLGDALLAFIRFAVDAASSPDPSDGEVWFATRRRDSSDPGSVYVINVFGDWIKYGWWDVVPCPSVRGVWLTEQGTVAAFKRRFTRQCPAIHEEGKS